MMLLTFENQAPIQLKKVEKEADGSGSKESRVNTLLCKNARPVPVP